MPTQSTNKLSKREREVLFLVATGKQSIEIAEILGLSKHTIDNHRKKMLKKADCRNTPELVQWGRSNGLLNGLQ